MIIVLLEKKPENQREGKKKKKWKKENENEIKETPLFSTKKSLKAWNLHGQSLQGDSLQGTDEPVDRREIDDVNIWSGGLYGVAMGALLWIDTKPWKDLSSLYSVCNLLTLQVGSTELIHGKPRRDDQ